MASGIQPVIFIESVPAPHLAQPSSLHAIFTAREINYFHHFLTSVSHPLPLGNDSVWLREIPQIAHNNHHLMHAILALGASEFHRANPGVNVEYDVLRHRGIAIAGLNKALANADSWDDAGRADAVLASCYSLIKQSAHNADAIQDFEVFVKGAALITERIRNDRVKTILNLTQDWPQGRLELGMEYIQHQIVIDLSLLDQGLETLQEIEDNLDTASGLAFLRAMRTTLILFHTSPVDGYLNSMRSFGSWYYLALGVLEVLREPENDTGSLLIATFFANMILIKLLIPLQIWPDTHLYSLPTNTLNQMDQWISAMETVLCNPARKHLHWARTIIEMIPQPSVDSGENTGIHDRWIKTVQDARHSVKSSSPLPVDIKIDVLRDLKNKAHMLLGDVVRLGSELTSWFEGYVYTNFRQMKLREPLLRLEQTESDSSTAAPASAEISELSVHCEETYPFMILEKLRA